jgi:hypothetical protein
VAQSGDASTLGSDSHFFNPQHHGKTTIGRMHLRVCFPARARPAEVSPQAAAASFGPWRRPFQRMFYCEFLQRTCYTSP